MIPSVVSTKTAVVLHFDTIIRAFLRRPSQLTREIVNFYLSPLTAVNERGEPPYYHLHTSKQTE